ncbi:N-acetylmuramoyl-L-alanine amidase [Mycobacterium sp. NPDC049093]
MTTKDQVAQLIVGEAQKRGHTRNECLAEMSCLYQESGWSDTIWDPTHTTYGVAQQDGSYPNRFDGAAAQIAAFYDRLDTQRRKPGASADIWLNICWLQQAPNWPSADYWYANGRRAYLTEIKSRIAVVTPYLDKYWPTTGGEPVADNRPDFNEWPMWSPNNSSRNGTKVDLFILHTQEGGGGDSAAEDLAKYLQGNGVSYHYTVGQASDGGVTVVDVVDTDYASWSVLSANGRSINLCFAGSRASWSRAEWMKQSKAIDAAAYLAVQDCKKYGIPLVVIGTGGNYSAARAGVTDHQYVTKVLKDGTHTDVGGGFPVDYFTERFNFWAAGGQTTPPVEQPKQFPKDYSDRELLEAMAADAREIRTQLGAGLDEWGEDGDLGRNAQGQRRTLRAGLAALIRKTGA